MSKPSVRNHFSSLSLTPSREKAFCRCGLFMRRNGVCWDPCTLSMAESAIIDIIGADQLAAVTVLQHASAIFSSLTSLQITGENLPSWRHFALLVACRAEALRAGRLVCTTSA
eukprot:297294-Chlamydomonas_euryale.AAC.1